MGLSLGLEQRVAELEGERETLRRQVLETAPAEAATDRDWILCFVMMSYEPKYDAVERALREVLEGPPYFFEVQLARDRHHSEDLRENLSRHLADADIYLADISELSPNVLLELGWPHFDPAFARRPKVILRSMQGRSTPVDLSGLVRIEYEGPEAADLVEIFRSELEKKKVFEDLLARRRGRRLHPELLEGLPFLAKLEIRELICRFHPTIELLRDATSKSICAGFRTNDGFE